MSDAAATLLWASKQGFASVLVVGLMPDGKTVIGHDASLDEIRATLAKASEDLEWMASRVLGQGAPLPRS